MEPIAGGAILTKFMEDLGGKLADQWNAILLAPAFVFWVGGLTAWLYHGNWTQLNSWIKSSSTSEQLAVLIGSLLIVVASGLIVQHLPLLSFFQARWPRPLKFLQRMFTSQQERQEMQNWHRFEELAHLGLSYLSSEQLAEFQKLDSWLHERAILGRRRRPTALGNILLMWGERVNGKYGLDVQVCWPRFWLLLPADTKKELTAARTILDTNSHIWLWGTLFLVWVFWAWWALPVGALTAFLAYQGMLGAARTYGYLMEASFDVHRILLYQALRWPLPKNPAEERLTGLQVTKYLWRGTDAAITTFVEPKEK